MNKFSGWVKKNIIVTIQNNEFTDIIYIREHVWACVYGHERTGHARPRVFGSLTRPVFLPLLL